MKHHPISVSIALSGVFLLLCSSCGPKIYQAPDFARQTRGHKIVAILPADVSIRLRPNQIKKYSQEQLLSQENETGYEITNSKLKELGIVIDDLKSYDRQKLADELEVDALITNSTYMDKPMSEGAAIVVGAILGSWGATNKVKTILNINSGDSGELLWKYDYQYSGSLGSSPDNLVTGLMRNASKKFPYQASH